MCFFLKDEKSDTEFLGDTRVCRSFIPASRTKDSTRPLPTTTANLHVSMGAPLTMYGRQGMKIAFNEKEYDWSFITADLMMVLLEEDFLTAHNLLVDAAARQLIPRTAPTSSPQKPSRHTSTKISTSQRDQQICPIATDIQLPEMRELLQEYEDVFKEVLKQDLTKPSKHRIQHHMEIEGPLIHSRFRQLAPENLTYAKKKVFKEMEEVGISKKPPAHGHHPYTWYQRQTEHGTPVETTDG
ncbi:uncharacterized protein [Macrobrachium rosenbergii]|uniref:uncharacterized protein n=1 Tax=Macrobrachium rosenbergii TaxID=79674 RepID=UPI0034D71750